MSGSAGWRRWLPAIVALALTAAPATVVRGDDETAPAEEAPLVIEAGPEAGPQTAVIIDDLGNLTVSGDAAEQVRACALVPGCLAFWQEGVGTVVIIGFTDIAGGGPNGELPPDSTAE